MPRDRTVQMMYELFEHTADIGIHVESTDLNSLFADAGCGLFAIITETVDEIQCEKAVELQVAGADKAYLMVDWLAELLISFELDRLLLRKFEVQVGESGLTATAFGETVDFLRHNLTHEVKAITYHGLKVERTDQGWAADVIVDI